jgi:hypothetical protein
MSQTLQQKRLKEGQAPMISSENIFKLSKTRKTTRALDFQIPNL